MMCYYLLRNNKESGPFTLSELKVMPLLKTDLIWVNGESTCWKSPDEVEDLQGLAKDPSKEPKVSQNKETSTAPAVFYTATTAASFQQPPITDLAEPEPEKISDEPLAKPSFEELKKKYAAKSPRKKVWKSQINIGANLLGIATMVIGVSVAAFMIKKAVDNIQHEPIVATAEAMEIGPAETHRSTSSQAAMAPLAASTAATTNTSLVPNDTAGPSVNASVSIKEPVKEAIVSSPTSQVIEKEKKQNELIQKPALYNEEPAADENKAEKDERAVLSSAEKKDGNKEADEKDEKKKSKPALQLSANDYKVGFLGGITNLELSVLNPSQQAISKAVVEVEYLKPNGKVVSTQTVDVSGIAPGASKKIAVPDNGRGVSVRYKVVSYE